MHVCFAFHNPLNTHTLCTHACITDCLFLLDALLSWAQLVVHAFVCIWHLARTRFYLYARCLHVFLCTHAFMNMCCLRFLCTHAFMNMCCLHVFLCTHAFMNMCCLHVFLCTHAFMNMCCLHVFLCTHAFMNMCCLHVFLCTHAFMNMCCLHVFLCTHASWTCADTCFLVYTCFHEHVLLLVYTRFHEHVLLHVRMCCLTYVFMLTCSHVVVYMHITSICPSFYPSQFNRLGIPSVWCLCLSSSCGSQNREFQSHCGLQV